VAQSEEAKTGIRMMLSFMPAIGAFLSAVFIFFYKLYDMLMLKVNKELTERRANEE